MELSRTRERLIAAIGLSTLVSTSILAYVVFPTEPRPRPVPEAAVGHWKRAEVLSKRVRDNLWRLGLNTNLRKELLADAEWHRRRSDRLCLVKDPDSAAETRADRDHGRLDDPLDVSWANFDGSVW